MPGLVLYCGKKFPGIAYKLDSGNFWRGCLDMVISPWKLTWMQIILSQAQIRTDLGIFNFLVEVQPISPSIENPIRYVLLWGKNTQGDLFNIFSIWSSQSKISGLGSKGTCLGRGRTNITVFIYILRSSFMYSVELYFKIT